MYPQVGKIKSDKKLSKGRRKKQRRRSALTGMNRYSGVGFAGSIESSAVRNKSVSSGTIVYSDLPWACFSDGECYYCHRYPNKPDQMMTDVGMKPVIRCSNSMCKKLMRPQL